MTGLEQLRVSLDGELFTAESPGYERVRLPQNSAFDGVRPQVVVLCRSEADVARSIAYAAAAGMRATPRAGGHCFAGRSSSSDLVLDVSPLDEITMQADGSVWIGAGARLGAVYRSLHAAGRTLPAGCGSTVGIAGLTLGGGIGLLGRSYGLTCDRLRAARIVLADGRTVQCDGDREPELFWALQGAGGGQFGVVTSLRFDTVPEPLMYRIQAEWTPAEPAALVAAWQAWAPSASDELTLDLTLERQRGAAPRATLLGASVVSEAKTNLLLDDFFSTIASRPARLRTEGPLPYSALKDGLVDRGRSSAKDPIRIRSEFFSRSMSERATDSVVALLSGPEGAMHRRLTFTAMDGAYNRPAEDATAFAHRNERFMLEHVGAPDDAWVDASWSTAHPEASGRVYPNFPDAALSDPLWAYHAGNGPRLSAIKRLYDPDRFFDFPQAIRPAPIEKAADHHVDTTKEVPS
jgi:FAD/FMN-containing dehydrogenase